MGGIGLTSGEQWRGDGERGGRRFYAQKERVMTVECHHAFQFPTLQLASSLLAGNV